jgi:hypothetical protein
VTKTGHQQLYLSEFVSAKSKIARELNRINPKFSSKIVPINVDVRRLVRLVTVEIKAIRTGSQDRWHSGIVSRFYALSIPAYAVMI